MLEAEVEAEEAAEPPRRCGVEEERQERQLKVDWSTEKHTG
jgi:hypothetical protein